MFLTAQCYLNCTFFFLSFLHLPPICLNPNIKVVELTSIGQCITLALLVLLYNMELFCVGILQRNPNLVRRAEERCGVEHLHMDMVVNMSRAGHLNTLIHNVCKEAHEGFYTQTVDTKHWLDKGKFGFHSDAL